MAKRRIILVLVVCFSIAVFTGQTLSRARSSNRTDIPPLLGEWFARYRQQEKERKEQYFKLREREAWKRLLRVTEQRWRLIEPKYEKVGALLRKARVGSTGIGIEGRDEHSFFRWHRRSIDRFPWGSERKPLDELTEGERIAEELIDLLENENAKDEEIRRKIDALQQAREKAKKELPKARQELHKVLTTARQEAVFLLMGFID